MYIKLVFLSLLFSSCQMENAVISEEELPTSEGGVIELVDETLPPSNIDIKEIEKEFSGFLERFKDDIKNNRVNKVKNKILFPQPAEVFHSFNVSAYCDKKEEKNEDDYIGLMLSENNFEEYYEVLFSEFLKNMILNLGIEDFNNDYIFDNRHTYNYTFLPVNSNEYKPCEIEHSLIFRFSFDDSRNSYVLVEIIGV